MIVEHNHFTSNLSVSSKIIYIKRLERLSPSLEAILTSELSIGNKINEVRSDIEDESNIIVLLQKQYHQDYENDQLTKLITTDAHDHGIYYITKKNPKQTLIAPYFK
ncbi:hypothetical protein SanaruYs_30530 [Chryseotalea sanaruensis]|uniref:Uncharacterized protein n=1 Tax=Chryseotalea sanaruensis TaxID=2482724 RepID=A0A401UD58_9BACT|nr:hypothetical protein [Chryseotalea sanaruensis]GCC52814.1 hypothetical protein SanaruYs_30530 [Chryseotalea sanaruensis]